MLITWVRVKLVSCVKDGVKRGSLGVGGIRLPGLSESEMDLLGQWESEVTFSRKLVFGLGFPGSGVCGLEQRYLGLGKERRRKGEMDEEFFSGALISLWVLPSLGREERQSSCQNP